jgi:hypothetical protein
MRLARDRRWDRGVVLAAVAVVVLTGCDNKPAANAPGNTTPGDPTPRQQADEFLRKLGDGTVSPAQFTATFQSAITRSKDPAADAREYIDQFRGANFVISEEATFGDFLVVRGRVEAPKYKEAFTLRMVKLADGYKADWLHRSERMGLNIKSPADPDLAAAQDTARNFVDLILGGDVRLAQALMTPAWRTKLAGPTALDTKDGLDYSPGFLTQTMRSWKGDATGYSVSKAELNAAKDEATITFEFDVPNGAKVPYAVKTVKATGQWLVASFDQRIAP